ncbi:MAG: DUF1786 domain-containing protein [Proteobacteria bacterium]|nr:DUF1786 domain-containing protein [Pseudomonadota bacterium]
MSRYLILDIGAGTMDILYHDTASQQHYKAVAKSPVLALAEEAERLSGKLLLLGTEMGGGTISRVLAEKAKTSEVIMSLSAAPTVHHNLERVRAMGITLVDDGEAEALRDKGEYHTLILGDLQPNRLESIMEGLGLPFSFDVVGICAQDHGVPPPGLSHLDYRHQIFQAGLDTNPFPHALLYRDDEIPPTFSRLRAISDLARRGLPTREIYVMDSGMAAILGASIDPQAGSLERILILDVATSHTVGAALEGGEMAGFFEYHTHDITLERLEDLLVDLAEGRLEHEKILKEGGHGAYTRKAFGFQSVEMILATGPKRRLVEKSRLPITLGAPMGDNMMTGTAGLLEAIRRRQGLDPFSYW